MYNNYANIKNSYILLVCEELEEYIVEDENHKINNKKSNIKTNSRYDKTFRKILSVKKNAAYIINKALMLNDEKRLKSQELEKYSTNFITNQLVNKQADIVYKLKNKEIYFLIEHQSKIDYSMAYRIKEYQMEIVKSAIDVKKVKTKDYETPIVIPIVLYTGKSKWNAKIYLNKTKDERFKNINLLKYNLIDINEYSQENLIESEAFIDKICALEKCENSNELIQEVKRIETQITEDEDKELFRMYLHLSIKRKLGKDKFEELLKEMKGDEVNMTALERTMLRENWLIRREGKREGVMQGRLQMLINMMKNNMKIEDIEKFAGATKEEIEKVKAMDKKEK